MKDRKHVCCIKSEGKLLNAQKNAVEDRCRLKLDIVENCADFNKYLSKAHPVLYIFFLTNLDKDTKDIYDLIRESEDRPPVLCVLDPYNWESYIDLCCEFGLNDFMMLPLREAELITRIKKAIDQSHTAALNKTKKYLKVKYGLQRILGQDSDFLKQVKNMMLIAQVDAPALILGETGTGKELFAHAMHYLSPRASRPFVPVNCGAIPVELFENELFGHVRGAYTDARMPQNGYIAEAEGGTLFLDEVDSIPYPAQVKLLRFLQEGEYKRLGDSRIKKAEVRIVAASNVNLINPPQDVLFRKDLLFRLNVFTLTIPPLRRRKSDIPLLANYFIQKYANQYRVLNKKLSQAAQNKLLSYDWPGNVRELENVILKSIVLPRSSVIRSNDIEIPLDRLRSVRFNQSFKDLKVSMVEDFEKEFLTGILSDCDGNVSMSAKIAELDRRSFYRLMKKYNIK